MSDSLRGTVLQITELVPRDRDQMFEVFARFYDDVTRAQFDGDLDGKDAVIILRDPRHRIRGFSTIKHLRVRQGRKTHWGVFSGDTVVDKPYWGTKVLGRVFLRYMLTTRLKRPWSPLWWFLISKGYKTYLLMANNFPEHWPRNEQATPPQQQAILDAFASESFPEYYRPERGVIEFPPSSGRLREGVAAVTDELLATNARVRFFADCNPRWQEGTELACIARMDWLMPIRYAGKALRAQQRKAPLRRLLSGASK